MLIANWNQEDNALLLGETVTIIHALKFAIAVRAFAG